jgi:hypothetical protein
MIQNEIRNVIERSDSFPEKTFQIEASAKAFRILFDGLYSDKPTAIMRELGCNAYDAHVTAGKADFKFDVHLPSTLEPFFMLRDYGIGLAHEDIVTIYTILFKSTKTNSNDQVGCLGLGSKSPFSYTDNFTVISYFNGVKTVYNMFLNENDIPAYATLLTEETTEHNGLEISFSVKQQDIYTFYSKARSTYTYFKTKPNFIGRTCDIPEVTYIQKRDGKWGLRDADSWGNANAVMGNVAYSMGGADFDTLTTEEKAILKLNIDIFFNIGELDVAASREKLSYNTQTKKNIKDKLTLIVKELAEELNNEIANCKSLWDAKILLHELTSGSMKVFRNIVENISVTFNGEPVGKEEICFGETDYHSFNVTSHLFTKTRRSNRDRYGFNTLHYLVATKSQKFFAGDTTKNVKARITKYIQEQKALGVEKVIVNLIHSAHPDLLNEAVKAFKVKIGMADDVVITPVSELPFDKVVRCSSQSSGGGVYNYKNTKKIFKYVGGGYSDGDNWEVAEPELDDGGVYVIINRYRIDGEKAQSYLDEYVNLFEKISDEPVTIYGIKSNEYSATFAPLTNWVPLKTYTETLVKDYIKDNELEEIVNISKAYNSDSVKCTTDLNGYHNQTAQNRTYFETYIDSLKNLELFTNKEIIPFLTPYVTLDIDKIGKYRETFKSMFESIEMDFPMIRFADNFNANGLQIVKDYIEIMIKNSGMLIDNPAVA